MTKGGGKLCSLKLQKPEMSTRTGRTAISRISIAVKNYTQESTKPAKAFENNAFLFTRVVLLELMFGPQRFEATYGLQLSR